MEAMEVDELDIEALDYFCALGYGGPKSVSAVTSSTNSPDPSMRNKKSKTAAQQNLVSTYQQNYRVPRPRIIKSDFRRYYANMWVNVFNSCDFDLMTRHLGTYYERDVLVQQSDLREDQMVTPHRIPLFQQSAVGVKYLGQFWYKGMTSAPDLVCSLRHTFVKVRSDGTSVIKCCFALKGTQISEVDNNDKEGIEKIARYQAKKAAGIRGITITEAAIVAVAPASMVSLPKDLKPKDCSAAVPATAKVSSPKAQQADVASSTIRETKIKSEFPATAAAVIASTVFTCSGTSDNTSAEDASMSSDNEGSISTKASTDAAPRVFPTRHFSSTVAARASDSPATTVASASSDDATAASTSCATLKRRRTESPPSPSITKTDSADSLDSPRDDEAVDVALVNKSNHKEQKEEQDLRDKQEPHDKVIGIGGKVDWMALADAAYAAGTLEPCKTHKEKQYFYSDPTLDGVGVNYEGIALPAAVTAIAVAPAVPAELARADCEALIKAEKSDGAAEEVRVLSPQASRKTVITASIDCICSIELEINADCKIVSVVLNYFR